MLHVNSESWKAVVNQLEIDRKALLEALIADADAVRTARLRGKIEMIDEIITTYPRELTKQAEAAD
ncbi:hypothetical protein ACRN98_22050 [Shewanella oncorhynchi]|uniref:hypothetical protein n=1 Tax=Shewanella oncorhynchi TaxID=2726434 RepID=UPI003D7A4B7F